MTTNIPEPGTYRARAVEWSWDTAKSGDPCLSLIFGFTGEHEGFRLDGRMYFDTDKPDAKGKTALDRSMEVLAAMGLQNGELSTEMPGIDQGEVDLVCEINEKGYLAVKWINAPRSKRELRIFAAPEPPVLNSFLAKVNSRTRAMTASSRAAGTSPVAARPAPVNRAPAQQAPRQAPPKMQGQSAAEFADDDIPF